MTALPGSPGAVRTTCPYCGTGCGVLGGGGRETAGDPDHPTNFGRVCAKGSALGETLGLAHRLLHPMIHGARADWKTALDLVAARFRSAIAEHGPDSVAFYVSGQLLTEDYYVANKLMKGFIGSGNIDTNSRLCMASSVAGHRRAFGEDVVPGCYEDLDECDLAVLIGSNTAWCHPILFRRLTDARAQRGTKIVAIDPRRTATAADADLFLPVRPGTDVLLFNGLLAHLVRTASADAGYIDRHTAGFGDACAAAEADAPDIEAVARGCDVPAEDVARFYDLFASTPRTVSVYSQGVNQSSRGTDKVNAIINCHLATGRIGKPGMGPFSVTGQPNAMGGREVGGLANQLAAHMVLESKADRDRVRRFWNAPNLAARPGLKAVDLFEAAGDGRIKALWIMGTNPAASLPDGERVRRALRACEFVVVSDCVIGTDTARRADVVLPAAAWGEKDGTVTNSERRISRQRAFMPLPDEARPDWWIICEIARRMYSKNAFDYANPAAIFREHAALSAYENGGRRIFDLAGLAALDDSAYENLKPVQWPVSETGRGTARLFGDGHFATPDSRGRFVAVRQNAPAHATGAASPMVLNTGRLRDQWHTMTRTGEVPRLMAPTPEPMLDLHPDDAAALRMDAESYAEIESAWGRAVARVRITRDQRRGEVFLPMHWTDDLSSRASPGRAVNPACDAVSGQPELKHTPAAIRRLDIQWEGIFLARERRRPQGLVYWSRTAVEGGYMYRLAGTEKVTDGIRLARELLPAPAAMVEDLRRGMFRAAELAEGGEIERCLLVAKAGELPDAAWLLDTFSAHRVLTGDSRRTLLSGRATVATPPQGRIVCSCFGVGEMRIREAIRGGATDVADLGRALRCGTNCGSCLPELRDLIAGESAAAQPLPERIPV